MSVTLAPRQPVEEQQGKEHHWTVEEFYRAYDAGEFGYSSRLELIQGRIVEKMPPGPHHSYLADAVAHMLRVALEPPLLVRDEKAIRLSSDSQPIPDISVVRGRRTDYAERHPAPENVALLVEISDTTAAYDLGGKAVLYSQAGITDYWVVLVNEAAIVQHRGPTPEGYQQVTRLAGTDTLSPLAMPEVAWTVSALLGNEE